MQAAFFIQFYDENKLIKKNNGELNRTLGYSMNITKLVSPDKHIDEMYIEIESYIFTLNN